MSVVATLKRRLRGKTPPPDKPSQSSLPSPLDLGDEAPSDSTKQRVYLVTLSRPKQDFSSNGIRLRAPAEFSKKQILAFVREACEHPAYLNHLCRASGSKVSLLRVCVFREFYKPDENGVADIHDHLPLLAEGSFRFMPVKRALLNRRGLASHWSCTHTGYWSALRYCVVPSPKKPLVSLDQAPEVWPESHPAHDECVHAPVTAEAIQAKRKKACDTRAEEGKSEPRPTDMDVWALVVRSGIYNAPDDPFADLKLAQYAKLHCSITMCHYLFKNRAKLNALIDDIWRWEKIDDVVAACSRTRPQAMSAALELPCVCRGAWMNAIVASFMMNNIRSAELCSDIQTSLERGRSEATPVVCLAGSRGGEGKSVFLKALHSVFQDPGFVFTVPDKSNFPLLDLPKAKVCFLDEYRFDPKVLGYATLCLWFDGSAVPVTRPQNMAGVSGHLLYKGSAPIFVTTKLEDMARIESAAAVNPATGCPYDADASMLLRRLKIYRYTQRIPKPPPGTPFCATCFSNMVQSQAAVWSLTNGARRWS